MLNILKAALFSFVMFSTADGDNLIIVFNGDNVVKVKSLESKEELLGFLDDKQIEKEFSNY